MKYDTAVARPAGNILSGTADLYEESAGDYEALARNAVRLARLVVKEVKRTEEVVQPPSKS